MDKQQKAECIRQIGRMNMLAIQRRRHKGRLMQRVPMTVYVEIPDDHDPDEVPDEVLSCLRDNLDSSGTWSVYDVTYDPEAVEEA